MDDNNQAFQESAIIDAERKVLGAIIRDDIVLLEIFRILETCKFCFPIHSIIFATMIEMFFKRGEKVNLTSLTDWLVIGEQVKGIDTAEYVTTLADIVVPAADIECYAKMMKKNSRCIIK